MKWTQSFTNRTSCFAPGATGPGFDVSFIDQSDEVALSTGFAKKPALNACVASTG